MRKVFNIDEKSASRYEESLKKTLGEELLTPTKIYVKTILKLLSEIEIKAMSHITGGGFYENIPRMLKDDINAKIRKDSFPKLRFSS